jgi:Putative porin
MRLRRIALLALLLTATAAPCLADEAEELRRLRDTTINLVNALVEQGVLTREKADAIIAQAQAAATNPSGAAPNAPAQGAPPPAQGPTPAAVPPLAPGTVRVPYIPETVKEEIKDQVKQDVLAQAKTERWGEPSAFPEWLRRFYFYGDIRLREEFDRFPSDGVPNAPVQVLQAYGVNIANSTEADNRLRFRARFGFNAVVGDTVTAGVRFASGGVGSGSNPGSENQTLGNYLSRNTVGFDRAFINYHPWSWIEAMGGRIGNPFFRPTTLVWADDVSLEGVLVNIHPQLTQQLKVFLLSGAFPILQIDPVPTNSADSKWLYAYQGGVDLRFDEEVGFTLAASLYDYRHIEGTPNPTIYSTAYTDSAAPFRQTGNTVFDINGLLNTQQGTQNYLWGLASKFHVANLSGVLDLGFVGPTHFYIAGDWVQNLGFNENEIEQRTGFRVDKQVKGWQTRFLVGYPNMSEKYSWQAYVGYRYVQRDATLDAFTDQDFHLGGTDAQGYYLGGRFAFERSSWLDLRWFSAKQIDGVELAGADATLRGLPLAIDVAQIDVNVSF